jgi:hypothetical protein
VQGNDARQAIKENAMATISDPTLDIVNVDDTTVKVTVVYTLTPSNLEKLAGSVFQEDIVLMGDDSGTLTPVFTFANGSIPAQYAVSQSTTSVTRSRDHKISKSTLNEDPAFLANGAENQDEILAQVTISYAANAPTSPTLPAPKNTKTKQGAWV